MFFFVNFSFLCRALD